MKEHYSVRLKNKIVQLEKERLFFRNLALKQFNNNPLDENESITLLGENLKDDISKTLESAIWSGEVKKGLSTGFNFTAC